MLLKKFFRFVIPSLASMWVFSMYTIVDGMFVAKGVGEAALASVNLSLPYVSTIFALGLIFATGISTVIAITLGMGDEKKASEYFTQNMIVVAILCIVLTVVVMLNLEHLARFLGATDVTFDYVVGYLKVIVPFSVFFVVSYNMEVLVKTDGTPIVSTIGVSTCALMNVVLDYLFVIRFGWGVEGAAFATGLAQATSCAIFLYYFAFKSKKLHFTRFQRDLSVYRRVLPVGLADGMGEMSNAIVMFAFNRIVLLFVGESALVSYTVISYINTFVLMTMMGTSQGTQPLISFNFGAQNRKNCDTLYRYGAIAAGVFSLIAFSLCQFSPETLISIFLKTESIELFAYTEQALRLYSFSFLMLGVNVVATGFFTAIERPVASLTLALMRGMVLMLVCLVIGAFLFGERGIWLSTTVSEALTLLLAGMFTLRYKRERVSD